MKNDEVSRLLQKAAVGHAVFWARGSFTVYISDAGQLFATKKCFDDSAFRKSMNYQRWHANHVIDDHHIRLLGWSHKFPTYREQTCVLLPMEAHSGRFNSVVQSPGRGGLGVNVAANPEDILEGYEAGYDHVGDYCGGAAARVKEELMKVVRAIVERGSK